MRTIRLYGELGAIFGTEFRMKVSSPSEAIRALSYQLKGFKKFMLESESKGLRFKVFSNDFQISNVEELRMMTSGEIRIVPVIAGANAEFRTLIGSALIAVAFTMEVASGGGLTPLASFLANTGFALAMGGAVEILTRGLMSNPIPGEKADNKPSYAFQGAINTTQQGQAVPVGYGTMIVGSAVISASITTESLLSGYVYETAVQYKDVWSYGTTNGYQAKLPPGWTSREEIEFIEGHTEYPGGLGSGMGSIYVPPKWLYRYYYNAAVLVLREL